jgi:hypothetical protein
VALAGTNSSRTVSLNPPSAAWMANTTSNSSFVLVTPPNVDLAPRGAIIQLTDLLFPPRALP